MTHTINVNSRDCYWMRNGDSTEYHRYKIVDKLKFLEQEYHFRRYLHLNSVYECLGVKWHPLDENVVFIRDICDNLKFDVSESVKIDGYDTFVVTIEYDDT